MISRQVNRQEIRIARKAIASEQKKKDRSAARRLLGFRQTYREKHGEYTGRPVADCMTGSRSSISNRKITSGWGGRILDRFKLVGGELFRLHATKGWRRA